MNAAAHQNVLPSFAVSGRSVLDVGCADGSTLMHPAYAGASRRCGIDVDREAIAQGEWKYPRLELAVAGAESLPYPDASFDLVVSKVSIIYTDIRKSLSEMARVLKPGGDLLLTMHDWRHQWCCFRNAVRDRAWVRAADHAYIVPASLCYAVTGDVPRRPSGTRETFQTRSALERDLKDFGNIKFERTKRDWIITANRV